MCHFSNIGLGVSREFEWIFLIKKSILLGLYILFSVSLYEKLFNRMTLLHFVKVLEILGRLDVDIGLCPVSYCHRILLYFVVVFKIVGRLGVHIGFFLFCVSVGKVDFN